MIDTDIERDIDTHDPTVCENCGNSGYVTQYIDQGRLIARVPCGCEQTQERDIEEDLHEPIEWWVAQKSWAKELKMTYSISVHTDITLALLAQINGWFKRRNYAGANYAAYCRQRVREYVLAVRQHRDKTRWEWI
jgi:hypothetical protein